MHPNKVVRENVRRLIDLPNIGKAMENDLLMMGIVEPKQLIGLNPYQMHQQLSALTHTQQDPCVIDVFLSIVRFMEGDEPQVWWHYTAERKAYLAKTYS